MVCIDSLWCFCDIFPTVQAERPGPYPGVTFPRGLPGSRPSRSHKLINASFTYFYYLLLILPILLIMDTRIYSNYRTNKPIDSFYNYTRIRTVKTCLKYRLSVIASAKKTSIRILFGNLDPNKRRPRLIPLPKLFYPPAAQLSFRFPYPSSPLKRRRSLGLTLEKQVLLKRRFRRRDENVTYKDFLLSSSSLPFIVPLLP